MKWRVVITDSENEDGVAPVCTGEHEDYLVYDCCPYPHFKCCNEADASALLSFLTSKEVEICQ